MSLIMMSGTTVLLKEEEYQRVRRMIDMRQQVVFG